MHINFTFGFPQSTEYSLSNFVFDVAQQIFSDNGRESAVKIVMSIIVSDWVDVGSPCASEVVGGSASRCDSGSGST